MSGFTILILILLILSIANNFIMYKKMFMYRDLSLTDSNVSPDIGFYPVNVYYQKTCPGNTENKCYDFKSENNPILE